MPEEYKENNEQKQEQKKKEASADIRELVDLNKKTDGRRVQRNGLILTALIFISLIFGSLSIVLKKDKEQKVSSNFTIIGKDIATQAVVNRKGVGVIYLEGVISYDKKNTQSFITTSESKSIAEQLVEDFKFFIEDNNTVAIVISVNSPGGSLVACEESLKIMQEIKQKAKSEKPIVVSMRTMAASGGYYLSMIADEIFANESTLTGSIGVISQFMNVEGLMDKVGLKMYTIKSGKNKDALSPYKEPSAEELSYWQAMTMQMVQGFITVVEKGREGKLKGSRDDIFDGRIFSGLDALKVGLVDNIGTINDAVSKAAELGGLNTNSPYIIQKPRKKTTPLNLLLSFAETVKPEINTPFQSVEEMIKTKYVGMPMYLYMPSIGGK